MIKEYKGANPNIDESCFVADSADIIGKVWLSKQSSVWYNCVIRGDVNNITIGENTNIQDGTIIHTDGDYPTDIGNNVTIGHKAIIHGCTLKDNVLVGMGAIVLNGAVVEENVLIGAGSIVTPGKRFPSGTLVLGAPAKVVRELTEEEINSIKESSNHYVELGKNHK